MKKPQEHTKEEVFEKLRASSERMLTALQQAYEAGMREGITDEEEDQVIEALKRAKHLRDRIREITSDEPKNQ